LEAHYFGLDHLIFPPNRRTIVLGGFEEGSAYFCFKEAKEAEEDKEGSQGSQEGKENKEVKEAKEAKEVKEAKEAKEAKETKETKETNEVKEVILPLLREVLALAQEATSPLKDLLKVC
jgi:hypothetical protein